MPHTTVSQSGMLSRSPGATNLPSSPMMVPPMSDDEDRAMVPMMTLLRGSRRPRCHVPRGPTRSGQLRKPTCPVTPVADLDVGELVAGDEDRAALGVGEGRARRSPASASATSFSTSSASTRRCR